jgi:hypothetical protein
VVAWPRAIVSGECLYEDHHGAGIFGAGIFGAGIFEAGIFEAGICQVA